MRRDGVRRKAVDPASSVKMRRSWEDGSVAFMAGRAPQVRRKANERLEDLIDPDRALREAAKLAYSNIQDLLDEEGKVRPLKEWPRELAAAVSSIDLTKKNLTAGDGKQEDVIRIRLWDKPANLTLLFKHLNLLTERLHLSADKEILDRLMSARERVDNQPAIEVEIVKDEPKRALPS